MIQPGLERIGRLLQNAQFPWKAVHVAGTNGKGSICGYTSNLLTRRLIPNGRFTSPHVVNRWDCIAINNVAVSEEEFRTVENHFIQLNERENINASEFEVLTATAFEIFNRKNVTVGVIEVGMGGKLDATNILNNQVVSVISKIAHDHQAFLGDTIKEIAAHKAGILRPNVPYLVNPMNEWNVHEVIDNYAKEIEAGPRISLDTETLRSAVFATAYWRKFARGLMPFQRDNAVLAFLAYIEVLKSLGERPSYGNAVTMLSKLRTKQTLPGRLQTVRCPVVFGASSRRDILVDGAHNEDAAKALKSYVSRMLKRRAPARLDDEKKSHERKPVIWVLAMTEGKDPRKFLGTLLGPEDIVITTTFNPVDGMPWVKPMDPDILLSVAHEVCPGIRGISIPKRGAFRALCAAKFFPPFAQIILTGSLYLVGDFFREHAVGKALGDNISEFPNIREIEAEERKRIKYYLNNDPQADTRRLLLRRASSLDVAPDQTQRLREGIAKLESEVQSLITKTLTRSRSAPTSPALKDKFPGELEDIRQQLGQLDSPIPKDDRPASPSYRRLSITSYPRPLSESDSTEDEDGQPRQSSGSQLEGDGSPKMLHIRKHLSWHGTGNAPVPLRRVQYSRQIQGNNRRDSF